MEPAFKAARLIILFDQFLNFTAYVASSLQSYLKARVHTRCKAQCGENEGKARAKLNYPAKTITVTISIYAARSNEKRFEGE